MQFLSYKNAMSYVSYANPNLTPLRVQKHV